MMKVALALAIPAIMQADSQMMEQLADIGVREAILWIMTLMLTVAVALLAFVIYKLRNVITQDTLREELKDFRKDLNEDMELLRKDVSVQISSRLPVLFDPRGDQDKEGK